MFKRFRLGTLFGFPVEMSTSFLILLGFVLLWQGGLAGVFTVLVAFASVLAHELGHAVVARKRGLSVPGIELHFFGGMAKLGETPRTANDEIAIAIAGPLVSLSLAGLGLGLDALGAGSFFWLFGWINLALAVFNMIPALPMDGGRVFRALLAKRSGFAAATETAVTVSRGFAIAIAVAGLAFGSVQLVLLSAFLWWLSGRERALAQFGGYRNTPFSGYRNSPFGSYQRPPTQESVPRDSHFFLHRRVRIRRFAGRLYIDSEPGYR